MNRLVAFAVIVLVVAPALAQDRPPAKAPTAAVITLEKGGQITLEFFPADAPKHVENFLKLARAGFYDGQRFHRVEPGFVVQLGDPQSKTLPMDHPAMGTGGPGYTIKAEFNERSRLGGQSVLHHARFREPPERAVHRVRASDERHGRRRLDQGGRPREVGEGQLKGNMVKQTGVITLEKGGEIRLEFYPEDAPKTVENFVTLAKKGFYNGLNFHRVVPDFVVQGGCPKGTGTGGPGYTIKAEFNKQKHVRGTLAMARSQSPDSAGSQFYICYGATPHLDGQYTVFGKVVSGMEHVDRIKQGDKMTSVTITEE